MKSKIKRYFRITLTTISILFIMLLFSMVIPQSWIKKTVEKSIIEMNNISAKKEKAEFEKKDIGEKIIIEANYLIDSKKPLKSLIEMNYLGSGKLDTKNQNNNPKQEYSRYWVGMILFSRLLFIFTDIEGIQIINIIILSLLVSYLVILVWKKSKKIAISIIAIIIMFSCYVFTYSIQYMAVPLIALIESIWLVKHYNSNDDKKEALFLVGGICTAFFDMLTIETLTLTLPLFIYCYLKIKDNNIISIKELMQLAVLWLIGYITCFATKWIIDILYFGNNYISFLWTRGFSRAQNRIFVNYNSILSLLKGMTLLVYPFCKMKYGYTIITIILIFSLWNILFHLDKRKYLSLLLICTIPIIRYMILFSHSEVLYGMTFRAMIPIGLLTIIICLEQLENAKNSLLTYKKSNDKMKLKVGENMKKKVKICVLVMMLVSIFYMKVNAKTIKFDDDNYILAKEGDIICGNNVGNAVYSYESNVYDFSDNEEENFSYIGNITITSGENNRACIQLNISRMFEDSNRGIPDSYIVLKADALPTNSYYPSATIYPYYSPKVKVKCDKETIDYGEESNCSVELNESPTLDIEEILQNGRVSVSKNSLDRISFRINSEGFKTFNLNSSYNIDYDEEMVTILNIDNIESDAFEILSFKTTPKSEAVEGASIKIEIDGISYSDVVIENNSIDSQSVDIAVKKKDKTVNPSTSNTTRKIILSFVLFLGLIEILKLLYKKKFLNKIS